MKNAKQPIANTVHEDNGGEKVQEIALAFDTAVQEINDPRTKTSTIDYRLAEILFTSFITTAYHRFHQRGIAISPHPNPVL